LEKSPEDLRKEKENWLIFTILPSAITQANQQ
jgi:hypothetical protein